MQASSARLPLTPPEAAPVRLNKILVYALYDAQGQREEDLDLCKGDVIEVLSTDYKISGGDGWWLGKCNGEVGFFPVCWCTPCDQDFSSLPKEDLKRFHPPQISFSEIICEEGVIGEGAYGKVYRGRYNTNEVAVKVAVRNKESFLEEGKLLWLLKHQNIIGLKGVCLEEPNICLVLEYARGGALDTVLKGHKIRHEIRINWAIQVARGMEYLHTRAPISLVHRDLKSANVLILEDIDEGDDLLFKTLKITDFGLARDSANTAETSVDGTYAWMAPEVITSSSPFSKASDVWSYGVMLWELLTGECPYSDIGVNTIIVQVGKNKLKLDIPNTCPKEWKDLMEACWDYDADNRPTFTAILELLGSSPSPSPSPGTTTNDGSKLGTDLVDQFSLKFRGSVMQADLDNDGVSELVVVGNNVGDLAIFKDGCNDPWRKCSGLGQISAIIIGDLYNSGFNVLVVLTADGWCYIFNFPVLSVKSEGSSKPTSPKRSSSKASSPSPSIASGASAEAPEPVLLEPLDRCEEEEEHKEGSFKPRSKIRIPANVKEAMIFDVNNDGQNELVVALTHRVVRAYKWQAVGDTLISLYKWEFESPVGSIALNRDGTNALIVAQPGGALLKLVIDDV